MSDWLNSFGDFLLNLLPFFGTALVVVLILVGLRLFVGFLQLAHGVLTLPMRRAERARRFLGLLESILKQGQPLEETLVSLARTRDLSMGARFLPFAALLEKGLSFQEALNRSPYFLPPQITAMLRAGKQMGDLSKVLPACRQLLKDATSQTRGAMNYLVLITFVVTPLGIYVFTVLNIFVFPKFLEVAAGTGVRGSADLLSFLVVHFPLIILSQGVMLGLLWVGVVVYIRGPHVAGRFPVLDQLYMRLPWRRRRMQRDFSTMLAVLLDAGMPEPAALTLAADCSANVVFRRRAARAVAVLGQGVKLPEAVQILDEAGEFRWRLRNALAGPGGFMRALAGWQDALDARAFQQEQAVAHIVTTAMVAWSGLFVGLICVSVFSFFVSLINAGTLW